MTCTSWDDGIIAFVTNAGWLDGNSQDGMRKCLTADFDQIYVFNLRGNALTQGETRRKEKGNVFGAGTKTPVCITVLVKKAGIQTDQKVRYRQVDDYLRREDKLAKIKQAGSVTSMSWDAITPNRHGDWINQRNSQFQTFIQLGNDEVKRGKAVSRDTIFRTYSGVQPTAMPGRIISVQMLSPATWNE